MGRGAEKTETPPQDRGEQRRPLLPALAWNGGKPRTRLSQVSRLSAEPGTRSWDTEGQDLSLAGEADV